MGKWVLYLSNVKFSRWKCVNKLYKLKGIIIDITYQLYLLNNEGKKIYSFVFLHLKKIPLFHLTLFNLYNQKWLPCVIGSGLDVYITRKRCKTLIDFYATKESDFCSKKPITNVPWNGSNQIQCFFSIKRGTLCPKQVNNAICKNDKNYFCPVVVLLYHNFLSVAASVLKQKIRLKSLLDTGDLPGKHGGRYFSRKLQFRTWWYKVRFSVEKAYLHLLFL